MAAKPISRAHSITKKTRLLITRRFQVLICGSLVILGLSFTGGQTVLSADVSLLAPVSSGQQLKIIEGYNNPLAINCPGTALPSQPPDHCLNQKYGLDLQPSNLNDPNILAPLPGVINWRDDPTPNCLGILTQDNLNLTICHFASYSVNNFDVVKRGQTLGTRMTDWIHLSLDDRYAHPTKPYPPVAFDGIHTIEGHSFDPGPDTVIGPTFNDIVITSTNGGTTDCLGPSLNNPSDGYVSTSQTIGFSWSAPSGCTFQGYTFRIKDTSNMDSGGTTIVGAGNSPTSRKQATTNEFR